jgi:hypothetical protein
VDIIEVIESSPVPWTVAKFAAAMGVSTDQIYDLIKTGQLPALILGNRILLDPSRTAECLRKKLTVPEKLPAKNEDAPRRRRHRAHP